MKRSRVSRACLENLFTHVLNTPRLAGNMDAGGERYISLLQEPIVRSDMSEPG